jgi:hypothetical protein
VVVTIAKNRSLGAAALVFIFVRLLTDLDFFFLTTRFFLGFFLEVVGFGVVSVLGVASGVLGVLSVGAEPPDPPDPLGVVSVGVELPVGMGLLEELCAKALPLDKVILAIAVIGKKRTARAAIRLFRYI